MNIILKSLSNASEWFGDHLWHLFWTTIVVVVLLLFLRILRVAIIKEGTAIAFRTLGRFSYLGMTFAGHHFNDDGNVVDGEGPQGYGTGMIFGFRIGGWVIYLWPLISAVRYAEQNGQADMFGAGIHVRLGNVALHPNLVAAETNEAGSDDSSITDDSGPAQSIPVDVKFVATSRIINPYKWLFISPQNVTAEVTQRLDSVLRAWVRSGSQEDVQAARGDGRCLWEKLSDLECVPVLDTMEESWGIRVLNHSIVVENIGYDPDYQAALKARSSATLKAQASVAETAGRVMTAVAEELGLTVKELKTKLRDDSSFSARSDVVAALKHHRDLVTRDRAAAGGDLIDARFGSTDGGELPDSLQTLAIGGGGMGVLAGGTSNRRRSSDRRDNRQGGGSPPPPEPDSRLDDLDGL